MYIAIICFILFAYYANVIRKRKGYNLAFSLYALYALSFISSALMGIILPGYCDNIRLLPTIYLLVVFCIWFGVFNCDYNIYLKDPRNKILANVMLIIMIPAFIYFLYYFRLVLTSGMLFVDDNIRVMLNYNRILPDNSINTLASFFSSLYFINIFLFFCGVLEKWGRKYNAALLISSLAFPLYCLCFFGRDGVVLWILNFVILFMLFKGRFSQKTKKSLSRMILVVLSISALIIVFISLNRFFNSDSDVERNWNGTLGYLGQQLGNFSDVFYVDFNYSGTLFPGFSKSTHTLTTNDILIKSGHEDEVNIFRYYVFTLVSGYGYLGGILVSIAFAIIIWLLSKKSKRAMSNFYLLLILLFYQIPMNGVFYYRQGISRGDIGYMLGILVLFFVYMLSESPHKKTIKLSNNSL